MAEIQIVRPVGTGLRAPPGGSQAVNESVSVMGSGGLSVAEDLAPGAGALTPNMPAGSTILGENFGTVAEAGGNAFGFPFFGGWQSDGDGEVVVVADAASPGGQGQAIEFRWDAAVDEAGVARATDLGGPWDELYVSWSQRWASGGDWDNEGPKIFYFGPGPTDNWIERQPAGYMRIVPQGGSAQLRTDDGVVPLDEYVKIELIANAGSPGRARLFVDGELLEDEVSVAWNGGGSPFNGMEWYAHINDIAVDSVYRVGHLIIAGRND